MGGGAARGAPTLYFDMRHTAISSTLIHRQAADALLNNTTATYVWRQAMLGMPIMAACSALPAQ